MIDEFFLFFQFLALIFIAMERVRGTHTSGVLFTFWFLLFFCDIATFRSHMLHATSPVSFAAIILGIEKVRDFP